MGFRLKSLIGFIRGLRFNVLKNVKPFKEG